MSTGTVPAKLLSVSSTALVWRRLPLISTSTWSGASPRSWMPRTESDAPLDSMRGKLIEGDRFCRAAPTSPVDSALLTSRAPKRSMGTLLSNTVRLRAREPTTVTWSMLAPGVSAVAPALAVACASWAQAGAVPSMVQASTMARSGVAGRERETDEWRGYKAVSFGLD